MKETKNTIPQNKMATEPVGKLILTMGVPMIFSMMLQALYNVVDSYFISSMKDTAEISNLGEKGVNALTLVFPVQILMIAISVGTGVGINALLSRSLGQGNHEKVNKIAGNAVFLAACIYLVFLFVGLFGVEPYMKTQTTDPVVLEMGTEYLRICTVFSFSAILFMIYEKLLQSTGRTMLSTIAQISGAVTNIILDPIMIFGLLGFPEMGMTGAGYATIISQSVSFILAVLFHHLLNKEVQSGIRYLKPELAIIKEIYIIGIPAIMMQSLVSVMSYGINIIFGGVSFATVTAYGVYHRIQQFVFFAAFGLNNAIVPIISFNYGMKNKQRVKDGIKYGLMYITIIMFVGTIFLQLFGKNLINLFALSDETIALCLTAMRIVTLTFVFIGANIAFQGVFQAFGKGMLSLIVSFIRMIVVILPVSFLFSLSPNAENIIWWAFPIAEIFALTVSLFFMRRIVKEKISTLP